MVYIFYTLNKITRNVEVSQMQYFSRVYIIILFFVSLLILIILLIFGNFKTEMI